MKNIHAVCAIMFLCAASLTTSASQTGFSQLAALQPSNAGAQDYFGYWVATSGDVIVANGNGGECVFVKPSGGWKNVRQTATLTASDGTLLQYVSIRGDTIVAAGANGAAAYVFVEPSTGWANMTQTAKLTATDAGLGFLGVSISGNTIVAGAPDAQIGSNQNQGAAYVFVEPAGGWIDMTQTAKLTAVDGAASDNFGYAVAIDGSTIVAGAPYASLPNGGYNQGAAYLFSEPADGWADMTATAKLTASDGTSVATLGYSVAVEGNTAVAGAPNQLDPNGFGGGAAYVFVEPSEGWVDTTETAQLSPSNGVEYGSAGYAVAIRGNLILVGSPGTATLTKRQGAYGFLEPVQGWSSMSQTGVIKPSAPAYIEFGHSVGVMDSTVVVGAPGSIYSNYRGIVYVFGQ